MFTANAAATVTLVPPFSPLFAAGVLDWPLVPPLFVDASLPKATLLSAFWLTSLPELSLSLSPDPALPSAPA